MSVVVTRHAKKRIKQRIHKSYQLVADEAFHVGVEHNQLKGKLRRYVDRIAIRGKSLGRGISDYKIYYGNLFLFSGRNLVTVLKMPQRFERLCRKLTSGNIIRKENKPCVSEGRK